MKLGFGFVPNLVKSTLDCIDGSLEVSAGGFTHAQAHMSNDR